MAGWPKKRRLLGTKVKRVDAPEKATGRAKYSFDINRPGLLHAMILRSPHAHAKITGIDVTPAEKMPGAKAVVLIGDAEAAYGKSEAVVEGTYGVPVISHQCLESHGLVAEWGDDGGLTVWASTQATVGTAVQLANRFKVPPTKVKCVTHYMGGGFGS